MSAEEKPSEFQKEILPHVPTVVLEKILAKKEHPDWEITEVIPFDSDYLMVKAAAITRAFFHFGIDRRYYKTLEDLDILKQTIRGPKFDGIILGLLEALVELDDELVVPDVDKMIFSLLHKLVMSDVEYVDAYMNKTFRNRMSNALKKFARPQQGVDRRHWDILNFFKRIHLATDKKICEQAGRGRVNFVSELGNKIILKNLAFAVMNPDDGLSLMHNLLVQHNMLGKHAAIPERAQL